MDIASRIKKFMDATGIQNSQFADTCGIPRPSLSQLLNGRNKKVSNEVIDKIHEAYPSLSILWLMFGEGDMETNANIKTSEPQNQDIFAHQPIEKDDSQEFTSASDFANPTSENVSEKNSTITPADFGFHDDIQETPIIPKTAETTSSSTFSFTPPPATHKEEFQPADEKDTITLTPGKGKRVTGIVVYYDDSTYESFIPDPTHRHPFMR